MTPPTRKTWKVNIVMTLVNERSSHTSGTRVQIFISTPRGKIHVPVVQIQFNISCCMSQIKTYHCTCIMCSFPDGFHIENLSAVIIHTTDENKREFVFVFFDGS